MEYTEEIINNLIKVEKIISTPPRREFKFIGMHFRNDFGLTSVDEEKSFHVFMRKHSEYQENFSIGLIYLPAERSSIQLIRFNGNHGEVVDNPLNPHPHRDFHIHKITPKLIEEEINDPKLVEVTDKYGSFEQAFRYFCKYINIINAESFFPELDQPNLFEDSNDTEV